MPKRLLLSLGSVLLVLLILFLRGGVSPSSSEGFSEVDLPILGKTLDYIERDYVESEGLDPRKIYTEMTRELEGNIAPFLAKLDERKIRLHYAQAEQEIPIPTPLTFDDLPLLFRQTFGFLNHHYEGRIEPKEREYLASVGVTNALDAHSNFLVPTVYKEFRIGTRGNFGGLGIVIGIRDDQLTVIAPLEETPAWKAGIRAKDRIFQIGEESTVNMSLTEAVEKLRGPIGSRVSLQVHREGVPTPLSFNLTRANIQIQAVAGRLLPGEKIALIKIKSFQEDTVPSFERLVRSLITQDRMPSGIILDLRNNPGGLLDQAIQLADRFLAEGVIVKTVGRREHEVEKAEAGAPLEAVPLVVLVNEGSASASEIIAGTFQNNDRALIIGNRTFGKGTVQTVYDLQDGSALKLTVAKYLTAGDHEVQSIGIQPDVDLFPVVVGKKTVDLVEEERSKKPEDGEKEPTPLPPAKLRIRYLASEPDEEDEKSYQIPLDEDYPVLFAMILLDQAGGQFKDRKEWLSQMNGLIEESEKDQGKAIETALTRIGIDWREGKKIGTPEIVVSTSLSDEKGAPVKKFTPGDSGQLIVGVENRGSGPAYQLEALSRSEDPLFSNLEFPFGLVAPGEKKEWRVPIKISERAPARIEPVEIYFREGYRRIPKGEKIYLVIEEIQPPLFSYSWELIDGGEKGTTGNRNGRFDPGETVGLRVRIRNDGPRESPAPFLSCRNRSGPDLFIEKGRADLPSLRSHQEGSSLLLFRLAKKIPKDLKEISLELLLGDKKQGGELVDRLVFPMSTEDKETASPGEWRQPPQIRISGYPYQTRQSQITLKGVITDDRQVKHLTLYAGNTKEVYLSPPSGESRHSFPFEIKLKLKEGMNVLTLSAEDDQELSSRKQWVVWREK